MTEVLAVGRRQIPVSHPERVLFPVPGVTKLDLARYYEAIGEVMVRHVRERPLALQSFPHGVDGERYFVKDVPRHYPTWIRRVAVPKREGGTIHQVLADNTATLVYLAGQNAITPHVWTSRADRLEYPDRIVFDLDPSVERFAEVRAAARALGDLLREVGLRPFAMTTGSRGLHVVTPLRRTADYDSVHRFVRALAQYFVARNPRTLTVEFRRGARGERIFVDVGRNAYGQHAVAPYAVRGLPAAPVATPLRWEELADRRLSAQRWTVSTVGDRIADADDPWRDIARGARAVGRAQRALERLQA
jgi:bifunctional non-homologous end joining protein LigD